MNLEQKIMPDLKAAMKAKDQTSLRGIRAIKAAILLAKTDGSGKELDEMSEIKMLQKLVKQRQDSYDIYHREGRTELAQTESEEIEVISRYLPQQMSKEELTKFIQDLVAKTGASSIKDMVKLMGIAAQQLAGKADSKAIAVVVKSILAG